jgi:hypothetical protein
MSAIGTREATVVGVFSDPAQAQQAVQELKRNGFTDNEIGVASRQGASPAADDTEVTGTLAGEGAATGIAAGAGVGALWGIGILSGMIPGIGPAIAGGTLGVLLSSAAAGAAAAGIAGALIGLGIPEEEANYYNSEFESGRSIVTVRAGVRDDLARSILNRHGGYDSRSPSGTPTNPR